MRKDTKGFFSGLFLACLLFGSGPVFGQLDLSQKDSLIKVLAGKIAPLEAAKTWELLGRIYRRSNADSTTYCYNQALKLFRAQKNLSGTESVLGNMSYHFSKLGDFELSNQYGREAVALARQLDSSSNEINHLLRLGTNFSMMGLVDSAQDAFFAALRVAEATDNLDQQYYALVNIGNLYYQASDYDQAVAWYKKAEIICRASNDERSLGMLLLNLSKALYYGDQSRLDTALALSREGVAMLEKYVNLEEYTFYGYLNLMEFEALVGNEAASRAAYLEADAIAESQQSDNKRMNVAYTWAVALEEFGQTSQALESYKRTYELAQATGDMIMMRNCAGAAAELLEKLADWKAAFEWTETYWKLKDSLASTELKGRIEELAVQYETEKKDKELVRQSASLASQQQRIQLQGGALAILALALGGGLVIYNQRRRLNEQQIRELEQEKEMTAIRAMVMGEEKERTRLAKDLHDGLGGLLSAAKLQLSALPGQVPGLADSAAFGQGLQLLDNVSSEARKIAHNLMPELLSRLGLVEALDAFCQQVSASGVLKVDFEYAGPPERLPDSLELSIYRITQELLNNVIKHANASEAFVQILRDEQVLSITVEDNGRGFAGELSAPGIGLESIRSRLAFLGGKMNVQSDPGRGASVFVEIVLNK